MTSTFPHAPPQRQEHLDYHRCNTGNVKATALLYCELESNKAPHGYAQPTHLGDQLHRATSSLDLSLGLLGDEAGLDQEGDVRQSACAEHLEESVLGDIDHKGLAASRLGSDEGLLTGQGSKLAHIHGGAIELLVGLAEVTHTDLSEVTRMKLIEEDAVMMLATSVTTAGRMLPVLAHATMSGGHVRALLAVLLEVCSLSKQIM